MQIRMKNSGFIFNMKIITWLLLLLSISSHAAAPSTIVSRTASQIQLTFDSRYADVQPLIKTIDLIHSDAYEFGMFIVCDLEHERAYVHFDNTIVLGQEHNPDLIASTLAHELGHCYVGSNELKADAWGLQLFIKTGGAVEGFVRRFKDRDLEVSADHPSDQDRIKALISAK